MVTKDQLPLESQKHCKIADKFRDGEYHSRRTNIRIDGLDDCEGENHERTQEKVERFLRDKLEVIIKLLSSSNHLGNFAAIRKRTRNLEALTFILTMEDLSPKTIHI